MNRSVIRAPRKPRAARETPKRASLVFRDFVRQLEKLDAASRRPTREGGR